MNYKPEPPRPTDPGMFPFDAPISPPPAAKGERERALRIAERVAQEYGRQTGNSLDRSVLVEALGAAEMLRSGGGEPDEDAARSVAGEPVAWAIENAHTGTLGRRHHGTIEEAKRALFRDRQAYAGLDLRVIPLFRAPVVPTTPPEPVSKADAAVTTPPEVAGREEGAERLTARIIRTLDTLRHGIEPAGGLSDEELRDVERMRARYEELRGQRSFTEASAIARTEYLVALLRGSLPAGGTPERYEGWVSCGDPILAAIDMHPDGRGFANVMLWSEPHKRGAGKGARRVEILVYPPTEEPR